MTSIDNLSANICKAIKTKKDIDAAIRDIIRQALSNDVSIQTIFEDIIKQRFTELKVKFWTTVILALTSLAVTFICRCLFISFL